MATELGSAFISVGLGTNTLAGDIKKAFAGAEGEGGSAGKSAGKGFGLGFAGIVASAVGALGIGSFLKGAVAEASGLGESVNAVNVVFGDAAAGIQELGKSAAKSLGLSNLEFNNLAVKFSSFAQTIAGPGGNVADTLKGMTGRASDFASVMNLEVADAAALFQSGLAGESEPLRAFGIDLSAAAVEAFALKNGISSSAASMTEAEKVQARYGLLMEKTAVTAGDFANTSDSLANRQRILSSDWKNAQATLGTALLPAISGVTGALIAGLGPAVAGAQKVITELTGGFTAMGAAFRAGDGDITSSGFAGVMERIGAVARPVFDTLKEVGSSLGASFGPLIPQVLQLASAFSPLGLLFKVIQPILPQLVGLFTQLGGIVAGLLGTALAAVTPIIEMLVTQLSALAVQFMPMVTQLVGVLGAGLAQLAPVIAGVIAQLAPLIMSLVSQLMPIIMDLVATILPPLISIFSDVIGAIAPLVTMIAGLLIPIIEALLPVVVTVFGVVADVIKSVMQIVQGIIQVVTGIISGDWDKVWSGIQNIFSGIWNAIVAVVGGAIKIVWSVISAGIGLVAGFVGDVLGNIGRFFADTWNNIIRGVGGFIDGFLGFFRDLPGNIMNILSGAGSWLLDVGRNIVQGLIDGISGMMGAIGRAVLSIVPEAIRGPFEQMLGIHSPSRVFREYGLNIGQGLILGLDDMHGKISNAVTGMVPIPSAPSFGAGSFTPASAGGALGAGTTNITINQVDDPIGTSHAVVRRQQSLAV